MAGMGFDPGQGFAFRAGFFEPGGRHPVQRALARQNLQGFSGGATRRRADSKGGSDFLILESMLWAPGRTRGIRDIVLKVGAGRRGRALPWRGPVARNWIDFSAPSGT